MAEGKVDLSQVKKIYSGTSVRTSEDLEGLIIEYSQYYWGPKIAERATEICRQMFAEGRVEQQRITHGRCPDLNRMYRILGGRSYWVTNKKKIVWRKEEPTLEKVT